MNPGIHSPSPGRPMRILLVSEDLPVANLGGAGKHAVLLGNSLIEAGHEVEMLGRVRAPGVEGHNDFLGPLHCGINLRGTGWQEHRFGAFLPGRREHVARRVWQAIRALNPARFDVVHYHGHHYALGAVVPPSLPFVHTVHDQGAECLKLTRFRHGQPCTATQPGECAGCATPKPKALQTALSTLAVQRHRAASARAFAAHEVIFVSDFLRRRFEANAAPQQALRAQVLHNFTDLRRMAELGDAAEALAHPAPQPSPPRRLALMVGRIDEAKGFGALLDAISDTLLQTLRLRLVGDGPQRAALQARHAPRGVEFAGLLSQAEVYRETRAADVCIVPSIWEEPCGTTLLEALALGKPVLALARGGTPELARYQRWPGQLVLAEDVRGLVSQLHAASLEGALCGEVPAASAALGQAVGLSVAQADVRVRLPDILAVYARAAQAEQSAQVVQGPHGPQGVS